MASLDDVLAAQQQYQAPVAPAAPDPAPATPAASGGDNSVSVAGPATIARWQSNPPTPPAAGQTGYAAQDAAQDYADYQNWRASQISASPQPQPPYAVVAPPSSGPTAQQISSGIPAANATQTQNATPSNAKDTSADKLAIAKAALAQPIGKSDVTTGIVSSAPSNGNPAQSPSPQPYPTTGSFRFKGISSPIADEFLHAATGGVADYAAAGGRWLGDAAGSVVSGQPLPAFSPELAAVRAPREQFEQQHPAAALAAGVAGGIASTPIVAPLFGTAEGAGALAQGANYLRNTAAATGLGGAQGAIDAPGDATVAQRATDAGKGALIGGTLGAATGAVEGLWNAGRALYNSVRAPLNVGSKITVGTDSAGNPIQGTAGQLNAVANNLSSASGISRGDLAASIPSASDATLVPGSEATMGQTLANSGLLNRERTLRMQNRDPFNAQDAAANTAQLNAVRNFVDPDVHAEAAGQYVLNRFHHINAAEDAEVTKAVQAGQKKLADATSQEADARGSVTGLDKTLGGSRISGDAATARQQYGSQIREAVQGETDASKKNISRLYDAIDPEGTLALSVAAAKKAGKEVASELIHGSGDRFSPAEEHWVATLRDMKPTVTYKSLQQTRRGIGEDMRQARMAGRDNEFRRLGMLRDGLDQSVADAVSGVAHTEAPHINAGHMGPDDAVVGRLAQHAAGQEEGDPARMSHDFEQEVKSWRDARTSKARADASINIRANSGERIGGNSSRGASAVSGDGGAKISKNGRFRDASGDQIGAKAPSEKLEPNFDADASARDAAARASRREHSERFAGSPKDITAKANDTPYKVADSQVAGRFWNSGAKAAENAQSLIKAVGKDKASQLVGDYVPFDLRSRPGMLKSDGTFNADKLNSYIDDHKDAFAAFPELRAKFGTVAKAQEQLDTLTARRAEIEKQNPIDQKLAENVKAARLKDFQDSAASFYLDKSGELRDPKVAIGKLMSSPNPGTAAAELMRMVGNDEAAQAGVKRNVVDWLLNKVRTTQQAGTTGEDELAKAALKNVVKDPKMSRALDHLLSPEENQTLRNIVADQDRRALAYTATGIKGSPGTAADLHSIGHGKGNSVMTFLVSEGVGEMAQLASGVHGMTGVAVNLAAGAGALLLNAMRSAGLKTIQDLEIAAVLHPATVGKAILSRPATPAARAIAVKRLAGAINSISGYGASVDQQ